MTDPAHTYTAPPRWARWAAYATALVTLPSGLWRIGVALGLPFGYTEQASRADNVPGWGSLYLIGLSALTTGAALLTVGLVRRWGESVPRWIPLIGGRPVPALAAVVPAAVGAVLLTLLWTQLAWWWSIDKEDGARSTITPAWETVVSFLYLPLVAWGPLLAAVTVSYYRRRRHVPRTARA